ncbi:MAG: helix-turn-helix transcriptional regulator, partial [Candidatus Omnitrophica bacterium]|nr:helix-turn-helix transcriptional regulator [Candidatus Omnitrophota bacterium]
MPEDAVRSALMRIRRELGMQGATRSELAFLMPDSGTSYEQAHAAWSSLGDREKAVALLAGSGLSAREIATSLNLKAATVRNYLSEIYAKLTEMGYRVGNLIQLSVFMHPLEASGEASLSPARDLSSTEDGRGMDPADHQPKLDAYLAWVYEQAIPDAEWRPGEIEEHPPYTGRSPPPEVKAAKDVHLQQGETEVYGENVFNGALEHLRNLGLNDGFIEEGLRPLLGLELGGAKDETHQPIAFILNEQGKEQPPIEGIQAHPGGHSIHLFAYKSDGTLRTQEELSFILAHEFLARLGRPGSTGEMDYEGLFDMLLEVASEKPLPADPPETPVPSCLFDEAVFQEITFHQKTLLESTSLDREPIQFFCASPQDISPAIYTNLRMFDQLSAELEVIEKSVVLVPLGIDGYSKVFTDEIYWCTGAGIGPFRIGNAEYILLLHGKRVWGDHSGLEKRRSDYVPESLEAILRWLDTKGAEFTGVFAGVLGGGFHPMDRSVATETAKVLERWGMQVSDMGIGGYLPLRLEFDLEGNAWQVQQRMSPELQREFNVFNVQDLAPSYQSALYATLGMWAWNHPEAAPGDGKVVRFSDEPSAIADTIDLHLPLSPAAYGSVEVFQKCLIYSLLRVKLPNLSLPELRWERSDSKWSFNSEELSRIDPFLEFIEDSRSAYHRYGRSLLPFAPLLTEQGVDVRLSDSGLPYLYGEGGHPGDYRSKEKLLELRLYSAYGISEADYVSVILGRLEATRPGVVRGLSATQVDLLRREVARLRGIRSWSDVLSYEEMEDRATRDFAAKKKQSAEAWSPRVAGRVDPDRDLFAVSSDGVPGWEQNKASIVASVHGLEIDAQGRVPLAESEAGRRVLQIQEHLVEQGEPPGSWSRLGTESFSKSMREFMDWAGIEPDRMPEVYTGHVDWLRVKDAGPLLGTILLDFLPEQRRKQSDVIVGLRDQVQEGRLPELRQELLESGLPYALFSVTFEGKIFLRESALEWMLSEPELWPWLKALLLAATEVSAERRTEMLTDFSHFLNEIVAHEVNDFGSPGWGYGEPQAYGPLLSQTKGHPLDISQAALEPWPTEDAPDGLWVVKASFSAQRLTDCVRAGVTNLLEILAVDREIALPFASVSPVSGETDAMFNGAPLGVSLRYPAPDCRGWYARDIASGTSGKAYEKMARLRAANRNERLDTGGDPRELELALRDPAFDAAGNPVVKEGLLYTPRAEANGLVIAATAWKEGEILGNAYYEKLLIAAYRAGWPILLLPGLSIDRWQWYEAAKNIRAYLAGVTDIQPGQQQYAEKEDLRWVDGILVEPVGRAEIEGAAAELEAIDHSAEVWARNGA